MELNFRGFHNEYLVIFFNSEGQKTEIGGIRGTFCRFSLSVPLTTLLVEAIIDTGAGISAISPELFRLLKKPSRNWDRRQLITVNNARVYPECCVDLTLQVDGILIKIQAVVLEINGFSLLLGNDALRQLKSFTVDYGQPEPVFLTGGIDFDLDVEKREELDRVVCFESQSIPARSMAFVSVEVLGRLDVVDRIVGTIFKVLCLLN